MTPTNAVIPVSAQPKTGTHPPTLAATRRRKLCGRDPAAGPGSCWWWWETCPAEVPDCAIRAAREQDFRR